MPLELSSYVLLILFTVSSYAQSVCLAAQTVSVLSLANLGEEKIIFNCHDRLVGRHISWVSSRDGMISCA